MLAEVRHNKAMFEKILPTKKHTATALTVAGLSVLAAGCVEQNTKSQQTRTPETAVTPSQPSQPAPEAKPLHVQNTEGLARGERITKVPIFKPRAGTHIEEKYTATRDSTASDVVLIYSKELSDKMFKKAHLQSEGFAVGFLVTEFSGGVFKSLVYFDETTKVVQDIEAPILIGEGKESFFNPMFSDDELGYSLTVERVVSEHSRGVVLTVGGPHYEGGAPEAALAS
jgi:hypothetical protein